MEYVHIFRKQSGVFFGTVLICLGVGLVWQQMQLETYRATLLLNIGRSDARETREYAYDSFYRLQADERFADTVVRWLGAPRIVEDIYADANLPVAALGTRDLKSLFSAKRLSSQMIEVSYAGKDQEMLGGLSDSLITVLNRYTESLNNDGNDPGWFVVIGSDPVIRDARVGFWSAFLAALLAGLLFGFWAVLLRHYFSGR